jgi:hypothetical protein
LPMNQRDNGENWNKYNFGEAGGLSYLTTPDYWGNQFGVTMNYYDKNIFGNNSTIATLDYQNTVYEDGKFDIKLGLRGGIATGYNQTTTSGNIPTITPQAFYKPVPIPKEESTVKFYRDNLGNSGTIRTMGNTIYIRRNNFK